MSKYKNIIIVVLVLIAGISIYSFLNDKPKPQISAVSDKITIDSLKEKRDLVLKQKEDQSKVKDKLIKDKENAIKKFDDEIDKANSNIKSLDADLELAQKKLDDSLKPSK